MFSIIALAGPRALVDVVKQFPPEVHFDKIVEFITPDDCGEFPDTSGYVREDFDKLVLTEEDTYLYKYMMKCIDAVDSYGRGKQETLSKLHFENVEFTLHGHTFGGKVFCVTGFVNWRMPLPMKSFAVH